MPDRPQAPGIGDIAALRQPRRSVLADDVYDILRDGLISRRIAPGSRLNLEMLARKLHVSNTPVRQALARLESEGLVTKEPYRGFAATPLLDSRTIVELYEYRLLIEPATAALAAKRRSEDGATSLEQMCDPATIGQLLTAPQSESELPQRDCDFHLRIAREATNSVILENLDQTLTRMRVYSLYGQAGAAQPAWEEHLLITEAIRARDPEAAAQAMRHHLTAAMSRIRQAVS